MPHILIYEDESSIAELIAMNLEIAGHSCDIACDGDRAMDLLCTTDFDLALLDIMVPVLSGFELLPFLTRKNIPAIYLSAKTDVIDKVKGLKLGAEDYITKPFEILELLVRIEKVLERKASLPANTLTYGNIQVNISSRQVTLNSEEVVLKPLEYKLLLMLIKHPGMVLTREQLLREVWGDNYFGETRTVDSHIAVIRKKLNLWDKIITVHRVGYKLEVNHSDTAP